MSMLRVACVRKLGAQMSGIDRSLSLVVSDLSRLFGLYPVIVLLTRD